MSHYYAKFKRENNYLIRVETRIYYGQDKPNSMDGKCLGIFFLKNPGSANFKKLDEWRELKIGNDKTLPWIRNTYAKVISDLEIKVDNNDYIRVLNLFTLCEPDIKSAIKLLQLNSVYLERIKYSKVPFLFIGWGANEELNFLRKYYLPKLNKFNDVSFFVEYYHSNGIKFILRDGLPKLGIKVKHPIGLRQNIVIEKIKSILLQKT